MDGLTEGAPRLRTCLPRARGEARLFGLAAHGVRAVGLKPIASGSHRAGPDAPLRNADALELQAAASVALPYDQINPYCFEPAIAPHLAAAEVGRPISVVRCCWTRPARRPG